MRKLFLTFAIILLCNIGFSQNVIDLRLQEVMNQKGDEMIDINIIFKSQIDYSQLRNRALRSLDKETKRNILVDEMRLFSEEKQKDVMSILQAETRGVKVTNIRTYWLSNAISCTASRDVIYLLAQHPDIEIIGYDEWQLMIPEESLQVNEVASQRADDVEMTDNIKMVNADKVWDLGYTGKGVLVAVIDSGVNYKHADLKDHLWDGGAEYPNHGYNVVDNNNDPMDGTGHGTHCAGTICGDGTSGLHTGMAPEATLMCIKALDNYGYGSASTFVAGMEFAIEHHADILSMSMGIMNASASDKTWMRNTCVNALELGVIASVAAGNDGNQMMAQVPNNVRTPGNCPPPWLHPDQEVNPGGLSCVVTVGAVDYFENMYENESKGPVTWTDTQFNDYPYGGDNIGLIRPDICAPGVGVKSLDGDTDNGYNLKSGTSMATPCVAGVMALMLEKNSELTPAEICMTLETTAKKLTETKSNIHGSGLIDAFKAVTSIKTGNLSLTSFSINDENENNNGNLNAGETVKLSVSFSNDSDNTFENIKAVLSTNNDNVTMTDAEAAINKIAAQEEISLADEFEFSVNQNTSHEDPLVFDIEFFDASENLIASFNILVTVYNNKLEFASFVVKNDDNDNGVLEAGETADLGVILNNTGNEIVLKVKGTLSCSDSNITINQAEADFNAIGSESSGVAFFNVTLSGNAAENLNIPFTIKTSDFLGKEKEFSGNYVSACRYIFQLEDSKWDGWDGAYLLVKYDNGNPTDTMTMTSGSFKEFSIFIKSNVEVTLEWLPGVEDGKYDEECSFNMLNEYYEVVYSSPVFPTENNILHTFVNDCSCDNEYYNLCDTIQELKGEQVANGIKLSWTAYGTANSYEVYHETKLIGTTRNTSFVDESVTEAGEYTYNVRMVSEDCKGLFKEVTVVYDDDFVPPIDPEDPENPDDPNTPEDPEDPEDPDNTEGINENIATKAYIYPNPVEDELFLATEVRVEEISIYDIYGRQTTVYGLQTTNFVYSVNVAELEAGIYFINIKTEDGNVVKRFVKK